MKLGWFATFAVVVILGSAATSSGASDLARSQELGAKPRLFAARLDPLTVRGVGFRPWEGVTVSVSFNAARRGAQRVRSSRQGAFSAHFAVQIPRCSVVRIWAIGSQGSRATYQLPRANCREP
jgi:hypothetical protein